MPTAATIDLLRAPPPPPPAPPAAPAHGAGGGPGPARPGACAPHPVEVSDQGAADFLVHLRAAAAGRPPVDAGLAGGLRAWLEDAAVAVAGLGREQRITPDAVSGARPGRGLGGRDAEGSRTTRRLLARTVFRLVLAGCPLRHPLEDALCALSVTGAADAVLAAMQAMARRERAALRAAVESDATTIASQWRRPPAAWLARPAERLTVPLAAGAVALEASVDLALGTPSRGVASVCLVDVRAGQSPAPDACERRFLALVETLRSGAPPYRVATYDAATGSLVVDDVDEALLVTAVHDVLGMLDRAGSAEAAA